MGKYVVCYKVRQYLGLHEEMYYTLMEVDDASKIDGIIKRRHPSARIEYVFPYEARIGALTP